MKFLNVFLLLLILIISLIISIIHLSNLNYKKKNLKPHSSSEPEPHSSSEPEPHSSSEPEPHSSSEPEPHSSSEPEPHSSSEPEPGPPRTEHSTVWTISEPNGTTGKIISSNISTYIGKNTQIIIDEIFNMSQPQTEYNEFSKNRYCFMFKPGLYQGIQVKMNYYTTFYGLSNGKTPIIFNGSYILNPTFGTKSPGSLDNFWRSIENINFTHGVPTPGIGGDLVNNYIYSVSQAAPLRNCTFDKTLSLFAYISGDDAAFASGGFISNVTAPGINCGSQQQFYFSNISNAKLQPAVWNTVILNSNINVDKTNMAIKYPVQNITNETTILKPILTENFNIKYFEKNSNNGYLNINILGKIIDNSKIKQIKTIQDFDDINNYSGAIVYPGFYKLKKTINIKKDNFILYLLGLPGLQAPMEKSLISINSNNVIIAGGLYESNPYSTIPNVIEINGSNCKLFDIFVRTTIDNICAAKSNINNSMIYINNKDCYIDNTWLWRADHISLKIHNGLGMKYCKSNIGLCVTNNGYNCQVNGLFSEHHLKNLVLWNGDNGKINFLQSEIPYDITTKYAYTYIPFKLNANNFKANGLGIYSFFVKKFWKSSSLPIVRCGFEFNGENIIFNYIFVKLLENACSGGGFKKILNNTNDINFTVTPNIRSINPLILYSILSNTNLIPTKISQSGAKSAVIGGNCDSDTLCQSLNNFECSIINPTDDWVWTIPDPNSDKNNCSNPLNQNSKPMMCKDDPTSIVLQSISAPECIKSTTEKCKYNMNDFSQIDFDFQIKDCKYTWAAPLWTTPNTWKWEAGSGELDYLELCPSDKVMHNFAGGGTQVPVNLDGGPDNMIGHLTSRNYNGQIQVTSCPQVGISECDFNKYPPKAKYPSDKDFNNGKTIYDQGGCANGGDCIYKFVSDIWNGNNLNSSLCQVSNGLFPTGTFNPNSKCKSIIKNIKIKGKNGNIKWYDSNNKPYTGNNICFKLNN